MGDEAGRAETERRYAALPADRTPASRYLRYACYGVFGLTVLVWLVGAVLRPNHFRLDELWFLVLLFVVPGAMVLGSLWVLLDRAWWRMLLGLFLLLPAGAVWVLVLLLAYSGFRVH